MTVRPVSQFARYPDIFMKVEKKSFNFFLFHHFITTFCCWRVLRFPNLLLLRLLLVSLSGSLGNSVQITLAGLGDTAATLLLVVLKDTNLLEGLHDLAVNGAGGVDVLGRTRATVLGGTVDLAETADTNGLAEVDVAGDGGGADVEPVNVLGRELLRRAGLDSVDPTFYLVSPTCPYCKRCTATVHRET